MLAPHSVSMLPAEFHTWSPLHLVTLAVCLGLAGATHLLAHRSGTGQGRQRLRFAVGWGCIAAWILNTGYWLMPVRFDPASSLPIHFCNVANLFGALAVLRRMRLFQGVIYFWIGLYSWAFLTPTVGVGPARMGFWV
ncbi:MAG: YwaF family protein, partial [Akkermansiaceae bacterium]|nr:YwaF family protein [Akkermansiaceae bacterium]